MRIFKPKPQDDRTSGAKGYRLFKRITTLAVVLAVVGVMQISFGISENQSILNAQSTPLDTDLKFIKSGNVVGLKKIVATKDFKTVAIRFKYTDEARKALATSGNKYKVISIFNDEENIPKGYQAKYGVFGSDGDGVMILHSKSEFKDVAILLGLNSLTKLADENQTPTFNEQDVETDTSASKDIRNELANEQSEQSVGDDRLNAKKGVDTEVAKQAKGDTAYFRLNPHSSSTEFIPNSENIDYNTILRKLFVDERLQSEIKKDKKLAKTIKTQKATVAEMERRYKDQPDDDEAKDNAETAQSALKASVNNQNKIKAKIEKYRNLKFDADDLEPFSKKSDVKVFDQANELASELIQSN